MKTVGYVFLGIIAIIALIVGSFTCNLLGIGAKHVENSVQNAVSSYDEYQDIYATCDQLNANLGILNSTPDNDKQFEQISKAARINQVKMQLNRWVQEYNAKSKHIDKKFWKSDKLPYQLSINDYSNYK